MRHLTSPEHSKRQSEACPQIGSALPDALATHGYVLWKQGGNSQNILGQFYDILHAHANVLIHKTSYDNFTTKILRSFFRCLM